MDIINITRKCIKIRLYLNTKFPPTTVSKVACLIGKTTLLRFFSHLPEILHYFSNLLLFAAYYNLVLVIASTANRKAIQQICKEVLCFILDFWKAIPMIFYALFVVVVSLCIFFDGIICPSFLFHAQNIKKHK